MPAIRRFTTSLTYRAYTAECSTAIAGLQSPVSLIGGLRGSGGIGIMCVTHIRTFPRSAMGQLQRLGVALRAGLLGFARTGFAVSTLTGSIPDARSANLYAWPPAPKRSCCCCLIARVLSGGAAPSSLDAKRPDGTSGLSGRACPTKQALHAAADAVLALSLCGTYEVGLASRSAPSWSAAVGRCEEVGRHPGAHQP